MSKRAIFNILLITIMLSNYYMLTYVVSTLRDTLRGKTVRHSFTQEKNELVISPGHDEPSLVIHCQPQSATLYLHTRHARARRNSTDVLPEIIGRIVDDISIHPSDRVVSLHLSGNLTLHCLLFGTKPNAVLVDATGNVIDAFLHAKSFAGPLELRPEEPVILDFTILETRLAESTEGISRVLRTTYPSLGATLVREALHRTGIPPGAVAQSIDAVDAGRLRSALMTMMGEVANPHPVVYVHSSEGEQPVALSIISLHHIEDARPRSFDDIFEAIRFFLSRTRTWKNVESRRTALLASVRQHVEKTRRALAALEREEQNTERLHDYERRAALLMAHHADIPRGSRIMLADGDGMCEIALDPKLTAMQNAQRYFEKVKSARAAQEQAALRVDGLRQRVMSGERLLEDLESVTTQQQLKEYLQVNNADLDRFGLGEKAAQREELPFRVFTVDGGFEVWAGKSSKNNDLLTMKYARPDDLWFHARGSSGSHVVLRADSGQGEPGKKAKEQAASIAAYYSKMKNASMVPVAMTYKKYVRKPKGAPPGTVVIEREKVIFAEPGLPDGTQVE